VLVGHLDARGDPLQERRVSDLVDEITEVVIDERSRVAEAIRAQRPRGPRAEMLGWALPDPLAELADCDAS
jgi:hypothetical protein